MFHISWLGIGFIIKNSSLTRNALHSLKSLKNSISPSRFNSTLNPDDYTMEEEEDEDEDEGGDEGEEDAEEQEEEEEESEDSEEGNEENVEDKLRRTKRGLNEEKKRKGRKLRKSQVKTAEIDVVVMVVFWLYH